MTKKDYVAVAATIKNLNDWPNNTIDYDAGWRDALAMTAGHLAVHFHEENPNFDRHKFLTACGF